jgi:hypothetical protein
VIAGRVASRLFAGAPCPVAVAPRGYARRSDTAASLHRRRHRRQPGVVERHPACRRARRCRRRHAPRDPRALPSHCAADGAEGERAADRRAARQRGARPESRRHERVEGPARRDHPARGRSGPRARARGEPRSRPARTGRARLRASASCAPRQRLAEVVRHSPCPVLVVPRSVEFDPHAGGMAARDEVTA